MTQKRSNDRAGMTQTEPQRGRMQRVFPAVLSAGALLGCFALGYGVQSRLPRSARGARALQFAQSGFARGTQTAYAGTPVARANNLSADDGQDTSPPAATFDSVYALVREHYVDPLPAESTMSFGAIRSMLATLNDPNAVFLDPDEYAVLKNEAAGQYSGIGASLYAAPVEAPGGYTEHKIEVVSTLPGSPAARAGLRAHDVITYINARWVLGSDPYSKVNRLVEQLQAADKDSDTDEVERETDAARMRESGGIGLFKAQMLLRGDAAVRKQYRLPEGELHLTVQRPGTAAPLNIDVEAQDMSLPALSATPLSGGVTMLRIPAFTEHSAQEIAEALAANPPAGGVALDLRGNAGGVGDGSSALHVAQQIEALFANGKAHNPSLFAVEQLPAGKQIELNVMGTPSAPPPLAETKLVLLVDGGTAGAAEALAAALSDSGRALLCGGKTFGDALVQSVVPLQNTRCAFTLITGRLESPKHFDWSGKGLTPKVALAPNASEEQVIGTVTALLNGDKTPRVATARTGAAR